MNFSRNIEPVCLRNIVINTGIHVIISLKTEFNNGIHFIILVKPEINIDIQKGIWIILKLISIFILISIPNPDITVLYCIKIY